MGISERGFAPVPARPDGKGVDLPEWLLAMAEAAAEAPSGPPAASVRHHVLTRRAKPAPERAMTLRQRSTPFVDRSAPVLRRFQTPRRIWVRRVAVAGVLLGSCAVLVSGIILTRGAGVTQEAPAVRPGTTIEKSLRGVAFTATVPAAPDTTTPVPADDLGSSLPVESPTYDTPPLPSPSESASPSPAPVDPPVVAPVDPPVDTPVDPPVDPPVDTPVDPPVVSPVDPLGADLPL